MPGGVHVAGHLPAADVDRLQPGLHHLHGLGPGLGPQGADVGFGAQQPPQPLGPQAGQGVFDLHRSPQAAPRPRPSRAASRPPSDRPTFHDLFQFLRSLTVRPHEPSAPSSRSACRKSIACRCQRSMLKCSYPTSVMNSVNSSLQHNPLDQLPCQVEVAAGERFRPDRLLAVCPSAPGTAGGPVPA